MAEIKKPQTETKNEVLVRIMGQDLLGSKKIYPALTKIKGVSWMISKIVCKNLGLDRDMKVLELDKERIKKIEEALKNLDSIPDYLKNRRNDFYTGESKHLISTDLDMKREFDIKRLKQIKSYKGWRHSLKLPVRGQRTRSHFRKTGVAVGVRKPKTGKKG